MNRMQPIYFDQAATSFPKAPGVGREMCRYIEEIGANVNRSTYEKSSAAEDALLETRDQLAKLFHFPDPSHVIFTPGQTHGLNYVMKGFLRPGDRVVTSSMEHNAVMRPLTELQKIGVTVVVVPAQADGSMRIDDFEKALTAETRLAVLTAASNVCGTTLPIREAAALCQKRGVPLCLDAAQTAGHLAIDMAALRLFALCVPGHKGLLGPQGVGAMLLSPDFAKELTPLVSGGTGSASDSLALPPYMPDRFESGTLNLPGIFGLRAALRFLNETGVGHLHAHEMALTARFLNGLKDLPGVRIVGRPDAVGRVGVVSVVVSGRDQADAAFLMEQEYGVCTRCGLHCAPMAHKSLGTFPEGTIRFSFGYGNTAEEIDRALLALSGVTAG